MLFRSHIAFALVSYLTLDFFIKMPFWIPGFILLGAIFVDIDSLNSKISRIFWPLSWILKHRGCLHSLTFCVLLSLLLGLLNLWAGFGFFIGYLSHLILDCFTRAGVKLFWPLGFRIRGFVKSGSWTEDIIFVGFLLLIIVMVFQKLF
ncbi:metal-dependent hydrolase [archaeon]|nr:metal-dependent hydrolase [archaeon]